MGGIVALLLLALLVFCLMRKKKRKEEDEKLRAGLPLAGHSGLASRSDSGSSLGRYGMGFPHEKR